MASCIKQSGPGLLKPRNFGAGIAVFKTASAAVQIQPLRVEEDYSHQTQGPLPPLPDFNDPQTAFNSKTTFNLFRTLCTLKACRIKPLVHNASDLLKISKACLGQTVTDKVVEATFFNHFCAGTNAETIKPTLAYLRQRGILPILNYAAEDDVKHEGESEEGVDTETADEKVLDARARIFMRSIIDCDNTTPRRGFVGIKFTGLAEPALLERMSELLTEKGSPLDRGHSSRDIVKFMTAHLDPTDLKAFLKFWTRVQKLAAAVHAKGNMRMMIDAEQTYLQPAIDALCIALQQRFNAEGAVIMNTYQCYLKCSAERIKADMNRAAAEGWVWGAKTVRGAYMHQERARAADLGYDSPIHNTLTDTNNNYNGCVRDVLAQITRGGPELLVASHNQASVEQALQIMHQHGLRPNDPDSGVYFGQLLGMADNLSFPLGAHGYNIYKICAYGSVPETIAFLLRRALENSDALGGVSKEIGMIRTELLRRLNPLGAEKQPHSSQEPSFYHA